ncbi:7108_t:CDS:2 [Paraglomus occultum]|uniref:7108_t:CDS:1 n=1 Tax=Paraglomus occultum TaxID=144539 RepID=A0A9N8WI94_9GLOM|nr:7108_t:CDS:2 [Paraglomus occultum]
MNESAEKDGVKNGSNESAVTNNQADDKTNDVTKAEDNRTQGDNTSLPDQKTQVTSSAPDENNSTKDSIDTILGQPKLSPEDRQRKHRELIEKQKEARQRAEALRTPLDKVMRPSPEPQIKSNESNGNTDSTTTTSISKAATIPVVNASVPQIRPQQPREQLIQAGLVILNSPDVQNMPMSRKIKTLKANGLTDEEIETAVGRVEKENAATRVPPVPPPIPRTALWKRLVIVLFITGSFASGLAYFVKKYVVPSMTSILSARQKLYAHQLDLFTKLNSKLTSISSPISLNSSKHTLSISSPSPLSLTPVSTNLTSITSILSSYHTYAASLDGIDDLHASLTAFAKYVSLNLYSYTPYGDRDRDAPVMKVKDEIRSLKGMLINIKNFPRVPLGRGGGPGWSAVNDRGDVNEMSKEETSES